MTIRRRVGQVLREVAIWPALVLTRAERRIAFLPSGRTEGSSLLRCFSIARALKTKGWQTLVIDKALSLRQRDRILRRFNPSICIVQKCRHPLNRASYLSAWPFVFDLDDADFLDPILQAHMEDMVRGARGVICGSRHIARWAESLGANTSLIWTATNPTPPPWPNHRTRDAIVSWAQAEPLSYQIELEFIRRVVTDATTQGARFVFRFYGWTEGDDHPVLREFREAGIRIQTLAPMPYREFTRSLRDVAVGLSAIATQSDFSRGKSFGKILGYLDAKVPVICSDEADHDLFFDRESGVVSNDPAEWSRAIVQLVGDPDARQRMADRAYERFTSQLSLEIAAQRTSEYLERLLAGRSADSLPTLEQ